ncbi:hypothetical protein HG536_0D04410 [Torulaspora globosa]|uniref:Zn(2)-C6 fungal-type domain-containing protein n=1 Tax=Torulaspora globosa TaxID=48254 RepID=A0A7G3ZHD3_9SACH|nr:uncharacterized protein HG536_0D04410 [Torulaspora globosa]QLL32919.1 hypothetical protein HG536_0D04410 [Torulaspora globosa]
MYVGKRTVESQPGTIRKRSKVTKACENCRRRKIKCTGKHPCSNCVTYQCECVYKSGAVPTVNIGQTKPSSAEKLGLSVSSENSTEANVSESEKTGSTDASKPGDQKLRSKNPSDAAFDPVLDCVFDNTECMGSDINGTGLPTKEEHRDTNGNNAVNGSDHMDSTKTDLASLKTYHPVEGFNGLYEDDMDFQESISELQCVLKKLVSMRSSNPHVKRAVAELSERAESLIENWEPKFSCDKYYETFKDAFEQSKSVETHLMKNKYYDQVFLSTYSVWTDASKKSSSENPFFRNQPLVDELFGLYSPLQGLSLRGIGFFFQQCTSGSESKEEIIQLKESLYLLLRFFDICVDQMNRSCVSIANPLESYIQRRNLMDCIPVPATNGVSPSSSNCRDLISIVIDRLPQPFVKRLTDISNEELRQVMYDDFAMFNLVLKMYGHHKKGFESLMMKITKRQKKDSPTAHCSSSDREDFIHFCEEEELLLALCYNYYNSTMYHVNEFVANLNYFEALLTLLEIQKWLDEFYSFEKVLGVAMRYAYDIGLSRWEHYVGLDEETAERRRKCWWRLYTTEKLYCFKKGKQSSIDDAKMNCLLTSEFRSLGFSDNKDFLSKVLTTSRGWAFDNMSIQDLKFYGECAISQVVSHFYATVLYSERYTSIKNTAKPPILKERLVKEVFQKLHLLKAQFDAIKEQTKKLFEVASSSADGSMNMFLAKDERSLAARYALFHGCFFFTVSTSAYNLIARLLTDTTSVSRIDQYTKCASFLRQSWREMTRLVLSLDDDYTVSRTFDSYGVVCMPLISRAFCDVSLARTSEDLVSLLNIFKRLQDITIFHENKDNEFVASSNAYGSYIRFLTFLAINIHGMMLSYMRLNNITRDNLFQEVEQMAPNVADLPPLILNPKSAIYEPLMKPVQASGFHLKVHSMLERDGKYTKSPNAYPKTAFQLMPIRNHEIASIGRFGSPGDMSSPREISSKESPYPTLPSIRSLTDVEQGSVQFSEKTPHIDSQQFKPTNSPNQERLQHASPKNLGLPYTGYNLGTLDEFISNGDLNDLYKVLWSDLYTEEAPQTILLPSDDYSGSTDK